MEHLVVYFALQLFNCELHVGIYELSLGEEFPESLLYRGIYVVYGLLHGVDYIIIADVIRGDYRQSSFQLLGNPAVVVCQKHIHIRIRKHHAYTRKYGYK